jgi:hypothetical protein
VRWPSDTFLLRRHVAAIKERRGEQPGGEAEDDVCLNGGCGNSLAAATNGRAGQGKRTWGAPAVAVLCHRSRSERKLSGSQQRNGQTGQRHGGGLGKLRRRRGGRDRGRARGQERVAGFWMPVLSLLRSSGFFFSMCHCCWVPGTVARSRYPRAAE